jgi:hypothetical protein
MGNASKKTDGASVKEQLQPNSLQNQKSKPLPPTPTKKDSTKQPTFLDKEMGSSQRKEETKKNPYADFDADAVRCCQLGHHVVLTAPNQTNFAGLGYFSNFPLELIPYIALNFLPIAEVVRLSLLSKGVTFVVIIHLFIHLFRYLFNSSK